MNSFRIFKNSEFVIYGASYIGQRIYQNLSDQQYNVIAFLDKESEKFKELLDIKVFDPTEEFLDITEKQNTIVIIAVTNEIEHAAIAEYVRSFGYKKIIYHSEKMGMDRIYQRILDGESLENIDIPFLSEECDYGQKLYFEHKKIVNETGKAYIPVELLFYKKTDCIKSVYQEEVYSTFYNFLEGKSERIFPDNFVAEDKSRWAEVERLYYKKMTHNWEFHEMQDTFVPHVEWDNAGHFIITSGLREVMFQICKNYSKILCSLTAEDFDKWANIEKAKNCYEIIKKENLSFTYTPVLVPSFYDFPCKREECGHTRLAEICHYLQQKNIDIRNKKILDAGACVCYFSQHMLRMGADVTSVEYDSSLHRVGNQLNQLMYCNNINFLNIGIQELDKEKEYDMTLMLTVLYWHLHTELAEQIMSTVDKVTKDFLIWESGDEVEYEKQWILEHSTFTHYEKIANTFGTGKIRELGVFLR